MAFGGGPRAAADGGAGGRVRTHALRGAGELALQDVGGAAVPGVRRGWLAVSAVRRADAAASACGSSVNGADSGRSGAFGSRSAWRTGVRRSSRGCGEPVGLHLCARRRPLGRNRADLDGISARSARQPLDQRRPDPPVDVHFNPPYDPWDPRLCAAPDGEFFKSLSAGTSSIVTGHIARFTERGIQMKDGLHVDADIIVTATGPNLLVAGGMDVYVDGDAVDWSKHVIFRGMMLDGVPNASPAIGSTNSSWTLKVAPWEMTRDYVSDRKLVLSGPVITPVGLRPAPRAQ